MSKLGLLALLMVAAMFLLGGCGSDVKCTSELRASLGVTVVGTDGKPVCRTTVTVRDGDYFKVLGENRSTRRCNHSGVYERKGTYSITATKGTRQATVDNIKVSADACHVHPRQVTITLGD
jgi:hypothetical protein